MRELQAQLESLRASNGGPGSSKGVAYGSAAGVSAAAVAAALTSGPGIGAAAAEAQAQAELEYASEWEPFQREAQRLEKEGLYVALSIPVPQSMRRVYCRYADAEQQYQAVLDAKRDRLGNESSSVAATHRDLGRVLALQVNGVLARCCLINQHKYICMQGRFDRAEEHYAISVRLCNKILGENNPNTACALTDLAAVGLHGHVSGPSITTFRVAGITRTAKV
jgi:hypothetical protein